MTENKLDILELEPAEAPSASVRPSVRSRLVALAAVRKRLSPRVRGGLVVVGGAVLVMVAWTFLQGVDSQPEPDPQPEAESPAAPQPDRARAGERLTSAELLGLARTALESGNLMEARRQAEEAMIVGSGDRRTRVATLQILADISLREGREDAAALLREEAAVLLSNLDDGVLKIFEFAETELAEGRVRSARRRFHQIALTGPPESNAVRQFRAEAERRLATSYEAEFRFNLDEGPERLKDPPVFIRGSR